VRQDVTSLHPEKKRKILQQFDELQEVYLSSRMKNTIDSNQQQLGPEEVGPQNAAAAAAAAVAAAAAASRQQMDDGDGASSRLQQQQQQQPQQSPAAKATAADTSAVALDAFTKVLSAVTSYNSLQPVVYIPPSGSSTTAAIGRGGSGSSSSSANANILSSIEFDCLGQLFAVAGEFLS